VHEVIKDGNGTENKTMYKLVTIQTTTMNAKKISAGNPDLAKITRIEMFIPVH